MTPEGIGGGFGEPPKDVGGKENFSVPEDVGRQDDKEVVNSGVESGEKSEEVLVGDRTEALAGEAPTSSKEGDLEPAKDGTVGIEKEVSSEEETEVLTGEVFTPGKDGSLEPVSKNGSVIDFSKKEPVVKEEGESAPKHGDVVFEDKEEYPEDTEEKLRENPEEPPHKERGETVNKIKDLLIEAGFLTPTDEQKDSMAESMEGIFKVLGHKVKSVSEMDNIIRDFEEKGNRSSYSAVQAENMRTDRQILSEAVSLAADDLTRDNSTLAGHFYLGSKHVDNMMDSSLTGLGWEISKRFIGNRSIDKRLNILEITRKGVDMADESSRKTYLQKLELTIERLGKDEFEDDSDVIQQDAALANLYSEKKFLETVNNGYNNNPDDGYGYAAEDPSEDPVEVDDKSSNKTDVVLEKLAEAAGKMTEAAEKVGRMGRGGKGGLRPSYDENGELVGGVEAAWQVTPEKLAESMLFMDSSVRWQSYTPPEWFKQLDVETQARIEYMIMVCDGASYLSRAGKDMEKIRGNPMYFAFDNQKMTKLFNDDFKTAMSYMLQSLCEFSNPDRNGQVCLQYKEGKNKKGEDDIRPEVRGKLQGIRDFKEEVAKVLAKKNGRSVPNSMDQMNAYTAWNLFYMFGDSSTADRQRKLPTYGGIICDGLRTLNPEYKAKSKWLKNDLTEAEWFGGPLGTYVQTVMQLERDLGRSVNGSRSKTLKEKFEEKKVHILDTKTFYGFLDFVSGGEKGALYRNVGRNETGEVVWKQFEGSEQKTLSGLLMDYAHFDSEGNIISSQNPEEWSFSNQVQVDFLNTYRDQMEAASVVLDATTGKLDRKDVGKYLSTIRTALGMVNGISINNTSPYKEYSRDPNLWANILLGSFGIDLQRLATDGIYLRTTQPRAYNLNIGAFLTRGLSLTDKDVELIPLMRLLGVDIRDGEKFDSLRVTARNEIKWKEAKKITDNLIKETKRKIGR